MHSFTRRKRLYPVAANGQKTASNEAILAHMQSKHGMPFETALAWKKGLDNPTKYGYADQARVGGQLLRVHNYQHRHPDSLNGINQPGKVYHEHGALHRSLYNPPSPKKKANTYHQADNHLHPIVEKGILPIQEWDHYQDVAEALAKLPSHARRPPIPSSKTADNVRQWTEGNWSSMRAFMEELHKGNYDQYFPRTDAGLYSLWHHSPSTEKELHRGLRSKKSLNELEQLLDTNPVLHDQFNSWTEDPLVANDFARRRTPAVGTPIIMHLQGPAKTLNISPYSSIVDEKEHIGRGPYQVVSHKRSADNKALHVNVKAAEPVPGIEEDSLPSIYSKKIAGKEYRKGGPNLHRAAVLRNTIRREQRLGGILDTKRPEWRAQKYAPWDVGPTGAFYDNEPITSLPADTSIRQNLIELAHDLNSVHHDYYPHNRKAKNSDDYVWPSSYSPVLDHPEHEKMLHDKYFTGPQSPTMDSTLRKIGLSLQGTDNHKRRHDPYQFTLSNAPRNSPELHRGVASLLHPKTLEERLIPGNMFKDNPRSWSSNERYAQEWTGQPTAHRMNSKIVFHLPSNSQALQVSPISRILGLDFEHQNEWQAGGPYKINSVDHAVNNGHSIYHAQVEQVSPEEFDKWAQQNKWTEPPSFFKALKDERTQDDKKSGEKTDKELQEEKWTEPPDYFKDSVHSQTSTRRGKRHFQRIIASNPSTPDQILASSPHLNDFLDTNDVGNLRDHANALNGSLDDLSLEDHVQSFKDAFPRHPLIHGIKQWTQDNSTPIRKTMEKFHKGNTPLEFDPRADDYDKFPEDSANLYAAWAQAPHNSLELHRGIKSSKSVEELQQILKDHPVLDDSFASWSGDPETSYHFAALPRNAHHLNTPIEFHLPPDSHALYVAPWSSNPEEEEWIAHGPYAVDRSYVTPHSAPDNELDNDYYMDGHQGYLSSHQPFLDWEKQEYPTFDQERAKYLENRPPFNMAIPGLEEDNAIKENRKSHMRSYFDSHLSPEEQEDIENEDRPQALHVHLRHLTPQELALHQKTKLPPAQDIFARKMNREFYRRSATPTQAAKQIPSNEFRKHEISGRPNRGDFPKDNEELQNYVYKILLKHYPASTLQWVKDRDMLWDYDPHVPLKEINMGRRPGGRNPKKVKGIEEAMRGGKKMDPVFLVNVWKDGEPSEKWEVADGYHRTLAYDHAGFKNIHAYTCDIPTQELADKYDSPWKTEMHDKKKNVAHRLEQILARRYAAAHKNMFVPLGTRMTSPEVSRKSFSNDGGLNDYMDTVKHESGEQSIAKGISEQSHLRKRIDNRLSNEILASHVAKVIGAPVPEIGVNPHKQQSRNAEAHELIMPKIPGKTGWDYGFGRGTDHLQGGLELGILDYLIANGDRHGGNYIISPDGKSVTGIDHEYSFFDPTHPAFNQSPFVEDHFDNEYHRAPVDHAWMRSLEQPLQDLKPLFKKYYRASDHTDMMNRYHHLTNQIVFSHPDAGQLPPTTAARKTASSSQFVPLGERETSPVTERTSLADNKGMLNSYVHVLTHANNQQSIEKGMLSQRGMKKEILASRVGQILGTPVGEVKQVPVSSVHLPDSRERRAQDPEVAIRMPKHEGQTALSVPKADRVAHLEYPGGKELGLFDYITNNSDRNGGNYLINPQTNQIHGIDHEFTFMPPEDGGSDFSDYHIKPILNGTGTRSPIDPDLYDSFEEPLKALAPEFSKIQPWAYEKQGEQLHEDMMERYYRLQSALHSLPRHSSSRQVIANMSPKELADLVHKNTVQNGGATMDLEGNTPLQGYSYGPYKDREYKVPTQAFMDNPRAHLEKFFNLNKDKLGIDGHHIGTWIDPETGHTYLDVVKVGEPHRDTIDAAQKAQQLAVYDLAHIDNNDLGTVPVGQFNEEGRYIPLDTPDNIHNQHQRQAAESISGSGNSSPHQVPSPISPGETQAVSSRRSAGKRRFFRPINGQRAFEYDTTRRNYTRRARGAPRIGAEGPQQNPNYFVPSIKSPIVQRKPLLESEGQGAMNTYVHNLRHENGQYSIEKGMDGGMGHENEILASHVGKAIGAPVGEVKSVDPDPSSIGSVKDLVAIQMPKHPGRSGIFPVRSRHEDDYLKMDGAKELGLFDYLIDNIDRNDGNYLVHPEENKVYGIDHELGFDDGDPHGRYVYSPFWRAYNPSILGHKNPLSAQITRPYVESFRQPLTKLLPKFKEMGRERSHEVMMQRYENLLGDIDERDQNIERFNRLHSSNLQVNTPLEDLIHETHSWRNNVLGRRLTSFTRKSIFKRKKPVRVIARIPDYELPKNIQINPQIPNSGQLALPGMSPSWFVGQGDRQTSPETKREPLAGRGYGTFGAYVHKINHANGEQSIAKGMHQHPAYEGEESDYAGVNRRITNELLASHVGKIVGAPVPEVTLRDAPEQYHNKGTEKELFMPRLSGVTGRGDYYNHFDKYSGINFYLLGKEHAKMKGGKELGVLDWLLDNKDRHSQNYLVNRKQNRVYGIDHEFVLGDIGSNAHNPFITHILEHPETIDPEWYRSLHAPLAKSKSVFKQYGAGDRHKDLMRNYKSLGKELGINGLTKTSATIPQAPNDNIDQAQSLEKDETNSPLAQESELYNLDGEVHNKSTPAPPKPATLKGPKIPKAPQGYPKVKMPPKAPKPQLSNFPT